MKRTIPSWLETAVFYEIYPQSFLDTNGDGVGDLDGIIRKLDYVASLGCNAIWMNPCFESPFEDAGYDVSDYYNIAPRYGTNETMKRLLAEAKKRGIRICLDLVPGHTSTAHPWFKQSCQAAKNRFSDWYIWTPSVWDGGDGKVKTVSGFAGRNGQYVTNFFHFQPALNFGFARPDPKRVWQKPVTHPAVQAVRREMRRIMRFWLDLGVDGFRVDMASSLVKNDTPDKRATSAIWREVRAMLEDRYPEAFILAEWGVPDQAIRAGFHADFILHFGPPMYTSLFRNQSPFFSKEGEFNFFGREGRGNILSFLTPYLGYLKSIRKTGFVAIPSGNHDMSRIRFGRNEKDLAVVFAFLLTMPGLPFIYYGDEIGMRYQRLLSKEGGYERTGSRTPMQWDASPNAGFSTAEARALYLPIDPARSRPTVAGQESDPKSLLHTVRALTALRKRHAALTASGKFTPIFAKKNTYPFVYLRSAGRESFLIAVNPSARAVSASFPKRLAQGSLSLVLGDPVRVSETKSSVTLEMKGVSYAILQVR
jgi:maltose alpha-D-glucosyltransferase/alpha-amylase